MWSSSRSRTPSGGVRAAVLAAGLALCAAAAADTQRAVPSYLPKYLEQPRAAGHGRLTWYGFHVYDARLLVPANFDARDPWAAPFALELTYARSLKGSAIAERSDDEMEKLGAGSAAQRATWLDAMKRVFPDVRAGTRITGVYLGERGARFYVDGALAGAIEDEAFARAFFAIWLDPRTSAPALRTALLSGAAPARP